MLEFIKSLFGLDLVNDEILLTRLRDILRFTTTKNQVRLNWGLLYIWGVKK